MTQTKTDTKLPAFSVHMVEWSFFVLYYGIFTAQICFQWKNMAKMNRNLHNFTKKKIEFYHPKIFVINKSMEIPKIILKDKINPLN